MSEARILGPRKAGGMSVALGIWTLRLVPRKEWNMQRFGLLDGTGKTRKIRIWCVALGVLAACADERTSLTSAEADRAAGNPNGATSPAPANTNTIAPPPPASAPTSPSASGARAAAGSTVGGTSVVSPPPPNSDRFTAVGVNPFVLVSQDPLSTFASDVDTASYDLFRQYVESGSLPDPASVRLEEYVNFFPYDYPQAAAEAEVPFSISLAAAPSALSPGLTLLRVGIQGKAQPAAAAKRPSNLVFLVDVSGSMSERDRLPLAQQVLRQTLDLLEPTDTVSIVSYASDTRVRLEPTPVSERDRILAQISQLGAGGSTAGASGIDLAYAQAQAAFIPGGINHVVLCTDGDFNVGVSSTSALVDLIRTKRQTGVTFTALGFGRGNLNDSMLEAISNAGNGFYGIISSESQAAEYVQERMLSTLSLIARDLKVQVEFNPERVTAFRLLGYENRALADDQFRDDAIDAGEIGAGHRVTALYELVPRGSAVPAVEGLPAPAAGELYNGEHEVTADDLVLVKVRYKGVDARTEDPALEVNASLAPLAVATSAEAADADFQWARAVAAFAEILKNSPYASNVEFEALAPVFEAQSSRDAARGAFYELFLAAQGML
jgi:Ca-activated chloride channel homolog